MVFVSVSFHISHFTQPKLVHRAVACIPTSPCKMFVISKD